MGRDIGGEIHGARPFLRWTGSKRQLLPLLATNTPTSFGRYFEPFLGSGQLFFFLRPRLATVADMNSALIATYRAVRADPDGVSGEIEQLHPGGDDYYDVRSSTEFTTDVAQAARFIYLNRHCFNGVWRTNRQGVFNVPRGRRTGAAPSAADLRAVASALRGRKLVSGDFEQTLVGAGVGDFVYLDPPYWTTDRPTYGEYGYGSYSHHDEDRLSSSVRELDKRGAAVLISLSESDRVVREFAGWHRLSIERSCSVGGRASRRTTSHEVLIANYPLSVVPLSSRTTVRHG